MSLPTSARSLRLFSCLLMGFSGLQCVAPSARPGSAVAAPVGSPANAPAAARIALSPADARKVGRKIWQNEAAGTVAGLTSWNAGERFASLGIGHFIWYPAGVPQTYEESFRPLLAFLQSRGATLPAGLSPASACPWPDRAAFQADLQGPRLRAIRKFLSETVGLQTEFIIRRLERALPKMIQAAPPSERQRVVDNFYAVSKTPNGIYALIDYVNFKGEGVNPKERYRGQGWGLLQVLQGMETAPPGQAAVRAFAASAKQALGRRIGNAPKKESQWRAGWFNRIDTYLQPW